MPSPTWTKPYATWTAASLIHANALRTTPYPLADLCQFAGHKLQSLTMIRQTMRREGRLSIDYSPVPDHPLNQLLVDTPPGQPLRDIGSTPPGSALLTTMKDSRALVTSALTTPDPPRLTRDSALRTLESFITSGAAGKDTDRYIKHWIDMAGSAFGSGPPPPATPLETHDRLLRLLLSSSPSTVRRAIASWEAARRPPVAQNPPAHPPEPALTAPEDPNDPSLPRETPTLQPLDSHCENPEAEVL